MTSDAFNESCLSALVILVLILCLWVPVLVRYILSPKSPPFPPENTPPNPPVGMVLCPLKSRYLGPWWTTWWQLHLETVYIAIPFFASLPKFNLCHFKSGRCWRSLAEAPQGTLIYSDGCWMRVQEYLRLHPPVDDLKKAPVAGWSKRKI